nr:MAG TPA: hypothetical protein [Caudoviricetes sp.]
MYYLRIPSSEHQIQYKRHYLTTQTPFLEYLYHQEPYMYLCRQVLGIYSIRSKALRTY